MDIFSSQTTSKIENSEEKKSEKLPKVSEFPTWPKNLSKIKLSEISEFSILGMGQNRKLGNLGNCIFFLLNLVATLQFPFSQVFFSFKIFCFIYYQTLNSKIGTSPSKTVSIHKQHLIFLVTEIFKSTSQKYFKLEI